ncbi:N,N-dimethylformamidase large subunit [Marivibrio halodurans]|uniref:N,N-dimethylformamidase large subunit n=1 Tax=Marivibrio halodurans TaxID=2039722 RepID=A0A8J7RZJ9_9PROT|nr:N,N-dimethylformamidase beta subunit family domain-containing protein [Marivibrio halodurans]MBP5857480.1 N,N-dimethylformamidase large subunit [Marivibrio halodurans]
MIPIIGYADELGARPGEVLGFKVSSTAAEPYEVQLVRIICADPNPDGPGIRHEEVAASCNGRYPSRFQSFVPGSHAEAPLPAGTRLERLTLEATVMPGLVDRDRQTIIAIGDPATGFSLDLSVDRAGPALSVATAGGDGGLTLGMPLRPMRWYRIAGFVDFVSGRAELVAECLGRDTGGGGAAGAVPGGAVPCLSDGARARIAAGNVGGPPARHFNGRIEAPSLTLGGEGAGAVGAERVGECLAAWDFSRGIDTDRIRDTGPHGLHGRLVNMPTRGVRGSRWTGREMAWPHAPEDYAAIHFHEDDCHDCGWADDFTFAIPEDFRSGVYAMRLRCAGAEDFIPFFVAAPKGRPRSDLCVVIPTFTYVMYGNNGRYDYGPAIEKRMADWGAYPYNPDRYRQFGQSSYNLHPDGTGISLCSWRRPLLNLRSGYLTLLAPNCGSGLRHYQADSHLWAWLEAKGLDFDVVTDHQLHADGAAALRPYRAVLTCTHPEYHTEGSLDAFQGYVESGGRLCYLGGNGFYWRIAVSDTIPGIAEVRRAEGGIRTWAAEPGEYYQALDGGYGGLWRRNGRPPQALAGVGFSAQGTFLGSYYRRLAESYRPDLSWIFDGIDGDILGDAGLSGSGAAGYELDRLDPHLGSPDNAVVLARSEAHAPTYVVAPEEILTHVSTTTGEPPDRLIHADMVYFDTPSGGAVFSVGSITFCGSLPVDDFGNPVSRLLENVVTGFLAGKGGEPPRS